MDQVLDEVASLPCLRCGAFVAGTQALSSALAVCSRCAWQARSGPEPLFLWPPPHILRARLALVGAAALLLAAGASHPSAPLHGTLHLQIVGFVSVGTLLLAAGVVVFAALAMGFLLWLPEGNARWKASIMEAHGLAPGLTGELLQCLSCKPVLSFRELVKPGEIGVLLTGPGGLAFFGEDRGRTVVPSRRIERCELQLFRLVFPFREVLKVTLTDGSVRTFLVMERSAAAENVQLTREVLRRLAG